MTRNGKIARLPRNIRETLNTRLDNGEPATDLVQWLNELPEVHSLLATHFEGRPINTQNLSDWKNGGFLDWQRRQESCDLIRDVVETASDFDAAAGQHQIPDRLAPILATELAAATRRLLDSTSDPKERWQYLSQALRHLNTLRQGDRFAARAALERLHLNTASDRRAKEEADREAKRRKDQAQKPIFDAMRRRAIITAFGGGENAEKIADDFLNADELFDEPPDSSPEDATSAPDQPKSR
jgi:hypothetical protein